MKRQLIEEECVRLAVNEAEGRWARADVSWETATFVIANDPEEGMALTESGKTRSFTFQGSVSIGMPSLTVIYEDQDPFLIIHEVKFWEPKRYVRTFH